MVPRLCQRSRAVVCRQAQALGGVFARCRCLSQKRFFRCYSAFCITDVRHGLLPAKKLQCQATPKAAGVFKTNSTQRSHGNRGDVPPPALPHIQALLAGSRQRRLGAMLQAAPKPQPVPEAGERGCHAIVHFCCDFNIG